MIHHTKPNRVAQPGAEAPGHTMLAFINQLNVQRPTPEPEIIDATVWSPNPDQPSLPGLDQPDL